MDIKDRAIQTKLEQTKCLEKCLTEAHEQIGIKEKDLEDKITRKLQNEIGDFHLDNLKTETGRYISIFQNDKIAMNFLFYL